MSALSGFDDDDQLSRGGEGGRDNNDENISDSVFSSTCSNAKTVVDVLQCLWEGTKKDTVCDVEINDGGKQLERQEHSHIAGQ
jgi:hypothetical protein